MTYEGAAFHPSLPDGRSSGTIELTPTGVLFRSERESIELPYRDLKIRAGGASNRLIFFEHAAKPEWSLYTTDGKILEDPRLTAREDARQHIAAIRGEKRRGRAVTAGCFLLIALVIAGLFALKDPLVRFVAKRIPRSLEQRLGEMTVSQVTLTSTRVTDAAVVAPLQNIVDRLKGPAAKEGYDIRLIVVRSPDVNAFAIPGGTIVLNTGLIRRADSAEEVAGVVAHEIAHVAHRHSLQQIVSAVGLFALVQALFGDVTGILAVVADGGAQLLTLSFSRDAEREADDSGLDYLRAAKIDPSGMLTFFRKMKQEEGRLSGTAMALISTHPATDERIDALERKIGDTRYPPMNIDFAALKKSVEKD